MILELTNNNFENQIKNTNKLILIDFWAAWCNPCQILAPIIEELDQEYKDRVIITKVNVDNNQNIAQKYEIRSIPTLLFFKHGKLLDTVVGVLTKEQIKKKINNLI